MKRRDLIKRLAILPIAGTVSPVKSLLSHPAPENDPVSGVQNKVMNDLHRRSFVMDAD